jgi:hypothetical protein
MEPGRRKVWVIESPTAERKRLFPPEPGADAGFTAADSAIEMQAEPRIELYAGPRAAPPPERVLHSEFSLPEARPGSGESCRSPDRPKRSRFLAAYLLGPLAPAILFRGRSRVLWSAVGLVSTAAAAVAACRWSPLVSRCRATPGGDAIFVLLVCGILLPMVCVWCRCIAAVPSHRSKADSRGPARNPLILALAGTVIPGLGLHLAGHPKRAAWAFALVAPTLVCLAVLGNWTWLWRGDGSSAGLGTEAALIAAALVLLLATLTWIVQALDGARRVATRPNPGLSSFLCVALLVSLAVLSGTFRPEPIAGSLHDASTSLAAEGFLVIPLVLSEAAGKIDPADPLHIAQAAALCESLGLADAASERRRVLEQRTRKYLEVVRNEPSAGARSGDRYAVGSRPGTIRESGGQVQ